jgi:sec-independent protein translocase protein TatC
MMSTVFFIGGAYFSYKTIIPVSISFFTSLTSKSVPVDYNITLENYLIYVIWMVFVGGLIFQLPIISIIFKRLGLIDHHLLRRGRRYSFLGIFIFAAILTPPDPFSQLLFSVPLIILYEVSIVIIRFMK